MLIRLPFFFVALLLPGLVRAATDPVESILAGAVPPPGVVFEIVDRDPRALELGLPWVTQAAQRLKVRFPQLEMALVTHGQEMFALREDAREANPDIHRLAEGLSREDGIPVHVCGTYAGWRGLAPEDFPDYIDVAATGPVQIRNYEALDWVRVVVPKAAALRPR
jgi:intracellular sulfur oxidation DsrE/DsrF family protein